MLNERREAEKGRRVERGREEGGGRHREKNPFSVCQKIHMLRQVENRPCSKMPSLHDYAWQSFIQILPLPFLGCVALCKSPNLSVLHFENRDTIETCLLELL
jgi:hypothetical protein